MEMPEIENYFIKNYNEKGLYVICDEMNISYKDGRNLIKRLKRKFKDFNFKLNPEAKSALGKKISKKINYFSDLCKVDSLKFIETPSLQEAYILGLLWADGYTNNKSQSNRIVIELVKDDLKVIQHLFKGWGSSSRKRKNRREQMSIFCSNKRLFQFLESMDYINKTYKSPDKILDYLRKKDSVLVNYWFRGYFDGDGCVYYNTKNYLRQISFSSGYEQDWTRFINELENINIKNINAIKSHNKNSNSNSSCLRFCGLDNCMKLFNFLYPNGYDFGFKRKYEIFEEINKSYNENYAKSHKNFNNKVIKDSCKFIEYE